MSIIAAAALVILFIAIAAGTVLFLAWQAGAPYDDPNLPFS